MSAILLASPLGALSQDWQFGIGASSELVRRGIAVSDRATVEARANTYMGNGWFLGVSGTTIRSMPDHAEGMQVVGNLGYVWPVANGWDAQLALSHYAYLGDSRLRQLNYDDLTMTLAYRDNVFISLTGSSSAPWPKTNSQRGINSYTYDVMLRYPFPAGWSVNAGMGYCDACLTQNTGYFYGNAGVNLPLGQMQASISYIAIDPSAKLQFGESAGNRWVLSLWRNF